MSTNRVAIIAGARTPFVKAGQSFAKLGPLALAAHEPQRTLERGYALVEDPAGEPVTSAAAGK